MITLALMTQFKLIFMLICAVLCGVFAGGTIVFLIYDKWAAKRFDKIMKDFNRVLSELEEQKDKEESK